jgi:hypothetical protein
MQLIRRALLVALLAAAAAVPVAAQNAVTFMPLFGSAQFTNRVTYQIVLAAPVIETEAVAPNTPACHTARAQLAAQVMRYPWQYAPVFATALITSAQVTTAGALTGALPATLDTPATDAALFSAVNAAWSSIAGCLTNP